jgi:GAF domain-containing protein
MPTPTPELFTLLAAEAEKALHALDASCVAVSVWERDRGRLRTLLNVGALAAVDEPFPTGESYPLDTFPSTDALLRFGRPYLDPQDVASLAVMAQMGFASQAAVPIVAEGGVWGELWAGVAAGGRRLTAADLATLTRGAEAIGRLLSLRGDA